MFQLIILLKKKLQLKIKLPSILLTILLSYAIFFGTVTAGQQNSKLLIQYELSNLYSTTTVSLYLGIIVAFSRIARLLSTIICGKVYPKLKNKFLIILSAMLLSSFGFILIGYYCLIPTIKFILMAIGFCIILSVRDPFRLYTQDIILKISPPHEHQLAVSYIQFARKIGTTICSIAISALLLKWDLIYVIFGISTLAFIEFLIAFRLYSLLKNSAYNT